MQETQVNLWQEQEQVEEEAGEEDEEEEEVEEEEDMYKMGEIWAKVMNQRRNLIIFWRWYKC